LVGIAAATAPADPLLKRDPVVVNRRVDQDRRRQTSGKNVLAPIEEKPRS